MNIHLLRIAYAGTLGAIAFAVAFALGTPLNLALGPAMGGIINAVVTAMLIAIGCKGVERFPYATVIWLAFSIPAVFTPTMGPPGPHKLLIALGTGLVMELGFIVLGRRAWAYFVVGGLMSAVMTMGILGAMIWLWLDEAAANKLLTRLWMVVPLYFLLGGLGMYLGHKIFDRRIARIDFVERLRESSEKEETQ